MPCQGKHFSSRRPPFPGPLLPRGGGRADYLLMAALSRAYPPVLVAGESPVHPLCTPCAYRPVTLTLRWRLPAVLSVSPGQSRWSPDQTPPSHPSADELR